MLLAVTATAMGFAFDAGSGERELSMVFAGCYALGCILAVLAVRQAGIFTAVIQPPLILFVAVPGAYFLFHGGQITSLKDTLINCGYPLIERFPLMFFTSAAVLLIGMARWYYGITAKSKTPATQKSKAAAGTGLLAAVTSKISSLTARQPADDGLEREPPRRKRPSERPARAGKATAPGATRVARKPVKRATPSRSRHTRPPEPDFVDPAERPRRPRPSRRAEPSAADEPRWRPRTQAPRERRQPPTDRRAAYERARRRVDDFDAFEAQEAARNGTHHPISRVRYRGTDDGDDARAQYRTRPRSRRDTDAWEYDA